MTDPDDDDRLDDLGKRIEAAKDRRRHRSGGQQTYSTSGLGVGLRIATELVAALAVSVGIGIVLDRWLGTTPWLLIVFFILGAATGFRNVVRVANNYDAARKREREDQARGSGSTRRGNGDEEG